MTRWLFFFFNDTATTEIYTLSLHDALPILITPSGGLMNRGQPTHGPVQYINIPLHDDQLLACVQSGDRKSTRLNSSHANISYAVFCLKKNIYIKPLDKSN